MEPQMKHKTHAAVLKAGCFRNCVNILIPTLFQSKLFPWSWSPKTDVNEVIKHRKMIISMLDLIPVIHENK